MDNINCSLFGLGAISCGGDRGASNAVNLNECQHDIKVHLSRCHLSRSNLKEYQLILFRAGLFHVTEEQIENMNICPNHRNKLGRFWRPLRSCQYPQHCGPVRQLCNGRDVFNVQLSEVVLKLYGKLVQVGSRKSYYISTANSKTFVLQNIGQGLLCFPVTL